MKKTKSLKKVQIKNMFRDKRKMRKESEIKVKEKNHDTNDTDVSTDYKIFCLVSEKSHSSSWPGENCQM